MVVRTIAHGRQVLKHLLRPRLWVPLKWLVLDTETQAHPRYKGKKDALVIGRTQIKVFSLCVLGESYTFPTSLVGAEYPTAWDWLELLFPIFADAKVFKVFHNANYDINAFITEGMDYCQMVNYWCTLIGAWKSNAALEKGLKSRAVLYGRKLRKTKHVDFDDLDALAEYAEEDVIQTDELFQMQMFGAIKRTGGFHVLPDGSKVKFSTKLPPDNNLVVPDEDLDERERLEVELQELPYLDATIRAEQRGFPFDVSKLRQIRKQVYADKEAVLKKIIRYAGNQVNLRSSQQLAVLFNHLGIPVTSYTKKGAASFKEEALEAIAHSHPIVKLILTYKGLEKMQSVYVGNPEATDPQKRLGLEYYVADDGVIRASASTVGAVTGRGSSSSPNLTQIPSAKDTYAIKSCFTA